MREKKSSEAFFPNGREAVELLRPEKSENPLPFACRFNVNKTSTIP